MNQWLVTCPVRYAMILIVKLEATYKVYVIELQPRARANEMGFYTRTQISGASPVFPAWIQDMSNLKTKP